MSPVSFALAGGFFTIVPPGKPVIHVTQVPSFFFFLIFWRCWVFIAVCKLSLAVSSGGCSPVAGHRL